MGRQPKDPLSILASGSRAHVRRAMRIGRSLDARISDLMQLDPKWEPSEDIRDDFELVGDAIRDAGGMLVRALDGKRKGLEKTSTAALEAQLAAEFDRFIQNATPEQLAALDRARAKVKGKR